MIVPSVGVCFGQPVTTKVFTPSSVAPGGRTTITFDVTNPSTTVTLTGVTFTDNLTGGLVVASPNNINGFCTGGSAGVANGNSGGTTTSLLNTTLVPSSHCTYNIDVIVPANANPGVINNSTGPVQSSAGAGAAGTATLVVLSRPTFTKSFGAVSIPAGATTSLTFNLTNPNNVALSALAFTDTLPAGLVVASPNGLTSTCGGTVTAVAGGTVISLVNGTLAAGASCTIRLDVAGVAEGTQNNTSSDLTSTQTAPGSPATATITIGPVLQVRYAANLEHGDSLINITNTGFNGAPLLGPGFGGAQGNICVNVYAFSPDEQLVACCSCLITPNGLVSLSVKNDLIIKTLTGVQPNSLQISLVTTGAGANFTGSTCTNSAALAGSAGFPIAVGAAAWGTTLHLSPVPVPPFNTTETTFRAATLHQGTLESMRGRCASILGNGSGFGVCQSCRQGAMGGARK